jgi:hypothetical protein
LQEVSRYPKAADQRRVAAAAMETIQRTETAKPDRKKLPTLSQVIENKGDELAMPVCSGRTPRSWLN